MKDVMDVGDMKDGGTVRVCSDAATVCNAE